MNTRKQLSDGLWLIKTPRPGKRTYWEVSTPDGELLVGGTEPETVISEARKVYQPKASHAPRN